MEKLFFTLLIFVLASACSGQYVSCENNPCPKYQVIETNKDFEVRQYVETDWITTRLGNRDSTSLMAAAKTLKAFCDKQKEAGHVILDGWPSLITMEEGDGPSTTLSWFLGIGSKPEITDTSVTLEHKSAFTVYVRAYSGTPSISAAEENKRILSEALTKAGKNYNANLSIGAFYNSYFSLTHNNEIWLYSA